MYLYYDSNKVLREVINDEAIVQGANRNKIFIYYEAQGDATLTFNSGKFTLPSMEEVNILTSSVTTITDLTSDAAFIPYDKNRDLKFFRYGKGYPFTVITPQAAVYAEDGSVMGTVTVSEGGHEPETLEPFMFMVERTGGIEASEPIDVATYVFLYQLFGNKTVFAVASLPQNISIYKSDDVILDLNAKKLYRITGDPLAASLWVDLSDLATETQLNALTAVVNAHIADQSNPHHVTKDQVNLGNVDNTSDANKPISTATQAALDQKAAITWVQQYVANVVTAVKQNSFQSVDTETYPTLQDFLDGFDDPEEGIIYLYPIDTSDLTKGYYEYIFETNEWVLLGATTMNLSNYYTIAQTDAKLALKQDVIADLAEIRSGAAAGATAVQPSGLKTINSESIVGTGNLALATKTELDEVKDELDSASVDVLDYSMAKVSGKDDGLALPEESQLELKALRGNTVAWNQLLNLNNTRSENGVTWTRNSANSYSLTGTLTAGMSRYWLANGELPPQLVANHKYIFLANSPLLRLYLTDGTNSAMYQANTIFTSNYGALVFGTGCQVRIDTTSGTEININSYFSIIDLTKLYGAGNEPTAITDPKAQWAINYALKHPAYDAGSLVSVDMSAYETIGFNQWDEEWELGGINSSTGQNENWSGGFRSVNYIKVLSNETYYENTGLWIAFYDDNKNYIDYINGTNGVAKTFTTPNNCSFIRFTTTNGYGTTYNHDICINVSDTTLNGTYKPYEKNIYPISFHGKSAGSVYDERKADGTDIVRVGSYTFMGNESWSSFGSGYVATIGSLGAVGIGGSIVPQMISTTGLEVVNRDTIYSGGSGISINSNNIYVSNSSNLTGKTLYYELATPVQSVNDPLPNAIKVYQNGTEWQINDGAPCGMEKDYDVSIKGQVITNVRVDARQEEEIKEQGAEIENLKETALTAEENGFVSSEYEKTLNLWDEVWSVGALNSNGTLDGDSSRRTTSFIKVIPNTTYYIPAPCTGGRYAYYDINKNLLVADINGFTSNIVTTPSGAYYLRITLIATYGTTYNHDIIIAEGNQPVAYQPYNGPVLHAIDVEGVKLWENGNPNSAWTSTSPVSLSQTINIGDELLIEYKTWYSSDVLPQTIKIRFTADNGTFVLDNVTASHWRNRNGVLTTNSISFAIDYSDGTAGNGQSLVPVAVYLIK